MTRTLMRKSMVCKIGGVSYPDSVKEISLKMLSDEKKATELREHKDEDAIQDAILRSMSSWNGCAHYEGIWILLGNT